MPVDRINMIIETASPSLIIYDDSTAPNLSMLKTNCLKVNFQKIKDNEVLEEKLKTIRKTMIDTDLLYLLFTSGSTGKPKGVAVSHRSVIAYAEWLKSYFEFGPDTVFGNQTPFYFSMSVLDIYATLSCCATMWIIPKMHFSFPVKLLEYIKEKGINTVYWVPSVYKIVANLEALEEVKNLGLKKILFAGEVMPAKQLNIWRKYIPNALYANLFGPTEITDIGVCYVLNREFRDDEAIPIGNACDNVGLIILDENGKEITEKNQVGELLVRGSFLAAGYYNDLEKTKEVFIQNPLQNAYPEIVYRTGDLVYLNEHEEIVYKSRKDYQIKHMGNRIELGEIEIAFSASAGVDMCCCLFDEQNDRIIGIYTGQAEEIMVHKFLQEKLPAYMVPNKYIKLRSMPLNLNGKIDRVKLRKEYI